MKTVSIRLGYYPRGGGVTGKQLSYIQSLLEKDFGDAYHKFITRYGCRNPYKRINKLNASKLIDALKENKNVVFVEKG